MNKAFLAIFPLIISSVSISDAVGVELNQYNETKSVRFTGNGTKTTRPFTVQDEWELQWTCEGLIIVSLYATGTNNPPKIIVRSRNGTGSSYYAKAGSYYLKVHAKKDWSIDIVELNPR